MTLIPFAASVFAAGFLGITQGVQTGEVVFCKNCQKELANTVKTVTVARWNAKDYSVRRNGTYCTRCGEEKVKYHVGKRCEHCVKVYLDVEMTALRKSEMNDRFTTEGFCSSKCETTAKIERAIYGVGQKTGEAIGRLGRGLVDGVKSGSR